MPRTSPNRLPLDENRRHGTRLRLPILVVINGRSFYPTDISVSGCALQMGGERASGLLPITLVFPPHNGEAEQFQLWTNVVRHSNDGRLALRFLDVDEDLLLALRELLERLGRR